MHYFLIFFAITSFALGHVFSVLALLARTSGVIEGRPYMAHSIEKIVGLVALLCLSLFVPFLAYLTETVLSSKNVIFLCAISQALTFFSIYFVYLSRYRLITYFSRSGTAYQNDRHIFRAFFTALKIPVTCKFTVRSGRINFNMLYVSLLAGVFLASGFFVGFYLAGVHSDFRLTISQMSIFINGIGTLITTLYGDSALARNLENENRYFSWHETISSYLLGRMLGYAVVGLIALLFFMN